MKADYCSAKINKRIVLLEVCEKFSSKMLGRPICELAIESRLCAAQPKVLAKDNRPFPKNDVYTNLFDDNVFSARSLYL